MTAEAGFIEALDLRPWNYEVRLIYSDWLDEHGLPELASTQRWLVSKEKYPCNDGERGEWRWYKETVCTAEWKHRYALPNAVFWSFMLGWHNVHSHKWTFPTRESAELSLAYALVKQKIVKSEEYCWAWNPASSVKGPPSVMIGPLGGTTR